MSVNDDLFSFQVAQQIRWLRFQNREIREALRILNRVDKQLKALLYDADPESAPFTVARAQALRAQVENLLNVIHDELAKVISDAVDQSFKSSAEIELQALQKFLPVQVDIVTPNLGVLQTAATLRPFNGAPLQTWVDQLRASDVDRTWKSILDGITSGTTTDDLVRNLIGTQSLRYKDGDREVSRRGVKALVRTSITHATNQGRQAVWEANEDLARGVQWVATLDSRTTPICRHRDGRVGPVVPNENWKPPPGTKKLKPPMARPPAHINCRSTTVLITKTWKELGFDIEELDPGTRASMNGQVPADLTYYQWLEKQSPALQKEVLGATRYDLWKNQGVAPERFVNDEGELLTLDELRRKIDIDLE